MKEKTITVAMRYKEEWINFLEQEARKIAYKENKNITYRSLIKNSIREKYPNLK